jgi:integrase
MPLPATSWLRNGIGLDHVRRLLGHASVAMTLRYSSLVAADLQRAHREAAAIERVVSGWLPRTRSRPPRMRGAQCWHHDG